MKPHEELARSEFERWLNKQFPAQDIIWVNPPTSEPRPDWYVTFENVMYGVEATSVVPNVNQGKSLVLESSISGDIGEFLKEIERKALAEGILVGSYGIAIGPIPNNQDRRKQITSRVLEYLRTTMDQSKAEPAFIDHVGEYDITVQKFYPGQNYLAELTDLGTRSDVEVIEDFQQKVRASLERKASLYKNFGLPVILLVLDGFHIVDPTIWVETASTIKASSSFEAVFRIKPANPPLLLFTLNDIWYCPRHRNYQAV